MISPSRLLCLVLLFWPSLRAATAPRSFPITEVAAGADATLSVQAALDACAAAGGGTVLFTAGTWNLEKPAYVRSHTTVQVAVGARVLGSLLFENAEKVSLVGEDRATSFVRVARFSDCRGVVIRDHSGETQWFTRSTGVRLDRITLAQKPQRQAEGSAIGFTSCRDVRAADCDFSSNDDVWCIKRGGEDIHLTRSILRGHLAAPFKIGTETDGVFRNISFTDSVVLDSDRAAVTIEAVDGATVEDVVCERLRFINVNTPLFIRLGHRDRYGLGRVGTIRRVVLRDIESVGAGKDEGFGSAIAGLPDHPVESVTLERVRLLVRGGGRPEDAADPVPERPEFYPEFDLFGKLPAYALYARHVRGLTLRDVTVGFSNPDTRPALVCDDVRQLVLDGFRPMGLAASVSVVREVESRRRYLPGLRLAAGAVSIRLIDSRGISIARGVAAAGVPFLEIGGARSGDVRLEANDLFGATAPALRAGPEVPGPLPAEFVRAPVVLPRPIPPRPGLPPGDSGWLVSALAAAAPGASIAVPRGHYRIAAPQLPLVIRANGVTLRPAEGPGSVRLEALLRPGGEVQSTYRTATPVELAGLALIHVAASNVTIEGLMLGAATFNVFAHGVDRLTLRENTFDFSRLFHVYLLDGRGHRIVGNRARASLNCVARLDRCHASVLEDNVFAENPAGFRLAGSSGNTIRRNRLLGLSWDAILLENGSNDSRVEGNEITGGRLTGIQIRDSHRIRVTENQISQHKTEAVLIDRGASEIVMRGNRFSGNVGLAVSNETPHTVDARENWWGSPDGPSVDGRGAGDLVDLRVDFADWLRRAPGS
jgi:parallel beta-helix repeat protein